MVSLPNLPPDPDDDLGQYLGLTAGAAAGLARERGWSTVRSLPPGTVVTLEYVAGRLNFEVADGRVRRCWKG
ncbi:I78 family peptidase inhibitor [Streptomyces sp. NPDC052396]|uniref:I78 family peptidase inhibitor n=1 Tax=Streptomyces sp. NPDC052396 TaxID=3365689 RepID=UPI0037D3C9ED